MPVLSKEDKLRLLTLVLESRHGDLREQNLNRQGKGHFHVSGMGHEGLAALGMQLRDGDYIAGYYRDRALVLGRGVASRELAIDYFAKRAGQSHGRQMPSHYSYASKGIWSVPTPTGAQLLPACYYVRTMVSNGVQYTNAGQASRLPDGSRPMITIASNTITTVLAHEFGHLLALAHVHSGAAPAQWFDSTNLMTTYGTLNQRFLTEGQVLRMHLSAWSVLNETYHARPGQLIRDCDMTSTTATATCPGVQKRIWADGTYPAN